MNIIPRSHSVVPFCPFALAISLATADVEKRSRSRAATGQSPYARAFLRHLCETREIRTTHLCSVIPEYRPGLRLNPPLEAYLAALDALIASRGEHCPLPLPASVRLRLFPGVAGRIRQRQAHRDALSDHREVLQAQRDRVLTRRRYRNLLDRAAIALRFTLPVDLCSWCSHWQDEGVREHDLLSAVMAWLRRFPSLMRLDVAEWEGEPFWQVRYDIGLTVRSAPVWVTELDRRMLPNQLTVSDRVSTG